MVEYLKVVLEFFSSLAWPVAVIVIVTKFRDELGRVIENIKGVKYPGGEVLMTQPEDPEALGAPVSVTSQLRVVDASGFYTAHGLSQLLIESTLMTADEHVFDQILLFRTPRQHTWLIASRSQLFCVLDDESTRSGGRLIQWGLPLEKATPIRARNVGKGRQVVDVGKKRGWLYSSTLHPEPVNLEQEIADLVRRAAAAS